MMQESGIDTVKRPEFLGQLLDFKKEREAVDRNVYAKFLELVNLAQNDVYRMQTMSIRFSSKVNDFVPPTIANCSLRLIFHFYGNLHSLCRYIVI